jgi:hypothetical protein
MEIWVFVLLAGVWAAFAWSSFFDNRRATPTASTRSFARSTALLASVSATNGREVLARQRAMDRRRRALVAIGGAAAVSLGLAIWQGSILWLGIAIAFDLVLAGYIGLLLYIKQQRVYRAPVVRIPVAEPAAQPTSDPAPSTVRVVAG